MPFPSVNYLTLLFEQFLKYSTERGRMGRPVKNIRSYVSVCTMTKPLPQSVVLNSRYASGAEHVEAALAGLGLQLIMIVARAV
jgi:hypothetical protein